MTQLAILPSELFLSWLIAALKPSSPHYFTNLFEDVLRLIEQSMPQIWHLSQPEVQRLASAGYVSAMVEMGDRLVWGSWRHGVKCDFIRASAWLLAAASQGDPNAHATLAVLYWKGNGVAKDRKRASHHAEEAMRNGLLEKIQSGDGSSICRALSIKRLGIDLGPQRSAEEMQGTVRSREAPVYHTAKSDAWSKGASAYAAFGHWEQHAKCMHAIVKLHEEHMPGFTPSTNPPDNSSKDGRVHQLPSLNTKADAISLLHELSQGGFARAQFELGLAYSVGNGVEQDHHLAVCELEKAVEQCEPGAMFVLARYYETGLGGVEINPDKAASCRTLVGGTGIDFTDLVLHAR